MRDTVLVTPGPPAVIGFDANHLGLRGLHSYLLYRLGANIFTILRDD